MKKKYSETLEGSFAVKIDRLSESNSKVWKTRINLDLTYCEVDDLVEPKIPHVVGKYAYKAWV